MKLLSYRIAGTDSFGILTDRGIVDLRRRQSTHASLRSVIAADDRTLLARSAREPADFALSDVALLPPEPDAPRIFCIGLNYKSHVNETGRDLPPVPTLFLRTHESVVGHGAPLRKPALSEQFDYEGELAVVIGRGGRHIPEAQALSHVFGYTCLNDGSVRDYQKHSVTAGKNFDQGGAWGPWIVTADEIPDPTRLTLVTRLNGMEVQRSTTDLLIYSIETCISYVSKFTELLPGDVIATGTPAGVGSRRTPQLWMKPGDTVEVDISSIGVLRNPVAEE